MAFKVNSFLNNYREVIWLLGDGRSGTTWVADLINYNKDYRESFEPFHPKLIPDANFLVPHQYIRANHLDSKLITFASNIFSGKYTNPRIDSNNHSLIYKGLLIKDIFANLLSYAVSLQFPKVKPILLIRNPFSVALSKYKKKNWFWVTEPLDLLNQKELHEDYLEYFEDIIKETSSKKNYILNQILIWSIINYIPLHQFSPNSIHISFYEEIYMNPNQEISKILNFVRAENKNRFVNLKDDIIKKPSRVIGTESNLLAGTSPITSWKNEINPKIIDEGFELLGYFGFDDLYNETSFPKIDMLKKIHLTHRKN